MSKLDSILSALREAPCTASDLRPYVRSRRAVIAAIYRLREQGHDIVLRTGGGRKTEGTYYLVRPAGDLRDWSYDRAQTND